MVKQLTLVACSALVLISTAVTAVAAEPQSKCLVSKNKCVSKKAGSLLKCEEKAETPGKSTDPNFGNCVGKAKAKFDGGSDQSKGCFEKLENKSPNDCITFDDTGSMETLVDDCVAKIVAEIDPTSGTQSKCNVGKKKCAAKKLQGILKCYQKAETPNKPNDPNAADCITKVVAKYDGGSDMTKGCFAKLEAKSNNDCQMPTGNSGTVEGIVDNSCVGAFVAALDTPTSTTTSTTSTTTSTTSSTTTSTTSTTSSPSTTTSTTSSTTTSTTSTTSTTTTSTTTSTTSSTTTTTTSTTTTTTGASFTRLALTTLVGNGAPQACGGAKLNPAAMAPFSGELDTDVACLTKVKDLGLGCLNIGGGSANVPPAPVPDAATVIFGFSGGTLSGNAGSSPDNCTLGAGPGKHCITSGLACTSDANCGGITSNCALDANCFFAPPLPIPNPANPALSTCVVNVIQTTASGTANVGTGDISAVLPLSSRTYVTANVSSPCPKCVSGLCNAGQRVNMACTTGVGSLGTTRECPPTATQFAGALTVNLNPLTTGTATSTSATGLFCPSQGNAGAIGIPGTRCIKETGAAAGSLNDGLTHPAKLGATFCIPVTGNAAVNLVGDLPGPGALGLNTNAQALP